jgi:type II secretory pathway pseudopilin PulG
METKSGMFISAVEKKVRPVVTAKSLASRGFHARGFSLVEVMFATSISIVVIGAVFSFMLMAGNNQINLRNKSQQIYELLTLKKQLVSSVALLSGKDLVINQNDLRPCLEGGPTPICAANCCTDGRDGVARDFVLLDKNDTNPDITKRRQLTGTRAAPVYYRADGSPCDMAATPTLCIYRIFSTFKASCSNEADSVLTVCDHAYLLNIELNIESIAVSGPGVRSEKVLLTHFVEKNYAPSIGLVADQILSISAGKQFISISTDAGSATEGSQDLYFETWTSSNPAVVKVEPYAILDVISGKSGTVRLEPLTVGTSNITLIINDGQRTNNLSAPRVFKITVIP